MEPVERKYALIKINKGDYILPSNDAETFWRIAQYTDGPSSGLDWPKDETVWGVWRWIGEQLRIYDPEDWFGWEMVAGPCMTRKDAISEALRIT